MGQPFCTGIPTPAPVCTACCEEKVGCGDCCYKVSQCGVEECGELKYRAPIFVVASFLSVIQIALSCYVASALGKTKSNLLTSHWTYLNIEHPSGTGEAEVYMGLTRVLVETKDVTNQTDQSEIYKWEDFCDCLDYSGQSAADQESSNCILKGLTGSHVSECNDCDEASASFHVGVIAGIASKFGQLTTDLTRSTKQEDVPCQKIFGMVTGVVGSLGTMQSLAVYGSSCIRSVPDKIAFDDGSEVEPDAKGGAAFIIIIICTVLGLPDSFCHMIIPCPEECADPLYLSKRMAAIKEKKESQKNDDATSAI